MIQFTQAEFISSAAELLQMPPDIGAEIAIVGRSNAGKSSALNALTNNEKLARVSKLPGRTQMLNFFLVGKQQRLVDLPGYGFAKAPKKVRDRWELLIEGYFQVRHSLNGLILVMDIRHPLKPTDETIINWAVQANVPVHILLNKADKLGRGAQGSALKYVNDQLVLNECADIVSAQIFSAETGQGLDECRSVLTKLLLSAKA